MPNSMRAFSRAASLFVRTPDSIFRFDQPQSLRARASLFSSVQAILVFSEARSRTSRSSHRVRNAQEIVAKRRSLAFSSYLGIIAPQPHEQISVCPLQDSQTRKPAFRSPGTLAPQTIHVAMPGGLWPSLAHALEQNRLPRSAKLGGRQNVEPH